MAGDWEKVAENLVRHKPSGGLYLRAKVGGKVIRKALGLTAVRIAKIKRDSMPAELRARAGAMSDTAPPTVEEALAFTEAWYESRQEHEQKASSLDYRKQVLKMLKRTLPENTPALWSKDDIEGWWSPDTIGSSESGRSTSRSVVPV